MFQLLHESKDGVKLGAVLAVCIVTCCPCPHSRQTAKKQSPDKRGFADAVQAIRSARFGPRTELLRDVVAQPGVLSHLDVERRVLRPQALL